MRFSTSAVLAALSLTGAQASLQARDTAACTKAITSVAPLLAGAPTPTGAASSLLLAATTQADPCAWPTATGSAGSALAAYSSQYAAWTSSAVPQLRSVWSACSDVPQFTSGLQAGLNSLRATGTGCSSLLAQITGTTATTASRTASASASASATATPSSSSSLAGANSASPSGTSSPSQAAGARETGLPVAAAALVAGVVAIAL